MIGRTALEITPRSSKASGTPWTLALLVVAFWAVVPSAPLKSLASVGGDADMKRPAGSSSDAQGCRIWGATYPYLKDSSGGSPGGKQDMQRSEAHTGHEEDKFEPVPVQEATTHVTQKTEGLKKVMPSVATLTEAASRELAERSGGKKQVIGAAVVGGACGSLLMALDGAPELDVAGIKMARLRGPLAGALAGVYCVHLPEDQPMGPIMRVASQKFMEGIWKITHIDG